MKETLSKKETPVIIGAGVIIGIIAVALVYFGNPANMGFCIACFLRDTTGALGFHSAAAVQYIRPEIVGLVLGSCILALATKEFKPRGGSAPVTRFVIGMFVMIGCLMFLGCPFRMILRLAGGDFNAIFGLIGFIAGISLIAGLLVGAMAQRTRLCMVGGIRDVVLFGEWKLLLGFIAILVSALIGNMVLGYFNPGFAGQPIAHTDGLWNALGMALAGFGCVLLGGCPLRQLVLAGEGNTDSAITVLGLMAGAAVAHNFGLASSGEGPTANGKIAVVIGFIVLIVIAAVNSMRKSEA